MLLSLGHLLEKCKTTSENILDLECLIVVPFQTKGCLFVCCLFFFKPLDPEV